MWCRELCFMMLPSHEKKEKTTKVQNRFVVRCTLGCREESGTPVLLTASVSDNSGNSPQMAAPRRSCEIDQSMQRFHVICDNRYLLGNEYQITWT